VTSIRSITASCLFPKGSAKNKTFSQEHENWIYSNYSHRNYKITRLAVTCLAVLHTEYNNGPETKFSSLPQVAPHSGHLQGGDTTTWRKWCDVHKGKLRHESVTPTARYITSLQQYP